MFKGNAISSISAGHYFFITPLAKYGLAVMSNQDFPEVALAGGVPSIISDNSTQDSTLNFLNAAYTLNFTYEEPNDDGSVTSTSVSVSEALSYIEYVDGTEYSTRTSTVSGLEKTIRKIQNSRYGCLKSGSGANAIKLFFHKKHQERIDRVPSFKGSTLITAHPRRQSGAKYAFKPSLVYEDVGVYVGQTNMSETHYASMVSAPLRLIFNHNQGVWETNSSFLCTLLEDIDGATILSAGLTKDNLSGKSSSDFYGADASIRMWDYTTGLAAPLAVQAGNPRSFGPNLVKYGGSTRVEKIRVVNRTTQLFSQGEIALVQQMGGENILIKIAGDGVIQERPPDFKGPWLFAKFLASSDEYFRYSDGDRAFAGDEIIDYVKSKLDDTYTGTRTLSPYWQETVSSTLNNALGRINVSIGTDASPETALDGVSTQDVKLFWGPLFSAGMSRNAVDEDGNVTKDRFQMPAEVYALGPFKNSKGEYDGSPTENCRQLLSDINSKSGNTLWNSLSIGSNWLYTGVTVDADGNETVTSPNLKPVDPNIIQFSFLSADLYGHLDSQTQTTNITRNVPKKSRNFYQNAATLSGLAAGTALFDSTFTAVTPSIQAAWEHIYDSVPSSYTGPKYDAYIQKKPNDSPKGSYDFFGEDPDYQGANAAGLTCARRLVFKEGAWNLNVDTEQVIGTQGVFYGGGGGGSISITILPFIGGWVNDTRGQTISGTTVVWGNSLNRLESFGTGALHVQVWDGWPREDMLWLAQYAQPLHFNPTYDSSIPATKTYTLESWNIADEKYEEVDIEVDNLRSPVDYRVPTLGYSYLYSGDNTYKVIYGNAPDGNEASVGPITGTLRPKHLWNVKTGRRRAFVTKYGLKYDKLTVGYGSYTVINKGEGFQQDQEVPIRNGAVAVVSVDADGGITGLSYKSAVLSVPANNNAGELTYNYLLRGEDVDPEGFPYTLQLSPGGGGENAEIQFNGYIWEKPSWDYGPKDQTGMTRVSLPSGSGQKRVVGTKTTSIGVNSNYESMYPGEYEIFAYCHNDIGIFLHFDPDTTTGFQMHNFIKATFS